MQKTTCPSCKAEKDKQAIRAEYVYGGQKHHRFWQCKDCDLIYLWPHLSKEEEAGFYAKEFEKFMSDRSASGVDWSGANAHIKANQGNVKRRLAFLEKHLKKGASVLEIGCSSGFMLEAFKAKGLQVVGVEPSKKFLDFLTQQGFETYASIDEVKNQKFDLITHFFVLEHIGDPLDFIKTQLNMLKPGGIIIAEIPCANDPLTSLYNIPAFERFYWSIAHRYYFNPKSLSFILDKLDCEYSFVPEQRYDLSNHLIWMLEGRPGGQNRFNATLSKATLDSYKEDLKKAWCCDTFFLYIKG